MHTGSATCISVWAIIICILVVPHVLVCSYNDMHTGSATCISVWAIMICILVVSHVLVCGL